MRVIVLAAGASRRLGALTRDRPKSLLPLVGRPLLERQLAVLAHLGLDDVTIVTGWQPEQLQALGRPTRHNPAFATSNMVASLMCAADLLDGGDDVLVSYADIVYEPRVAAALIAADASLAVAVDAGWLRLWRARSDDPLADAETLRLSDDGHVLELGKRPRTLGEIEAQYMGLIRIGAAAAPRVVAAWEALEPAGHYDGKDRANMYMTSFLQHLVDGGWPLRAVVVEGGWLEVDRASDLVAYERLARRGELRTLCDLEAAG